VLAAAGCGSDVRPSPGSSPGEPGARDVAAAWYGDVAGNDPADACRLMATSLRRTFIEVSHAGTCEDAVRTYRGSLGEPDRAAMLHKAFTLTMDGSDYASVDLSTGSSNTFGISWAHGRWWMSDIDQ
jgi:hypothetical protein